MKQDDSVSALTVLCDTDEIDNVLNQTNEGAHDMEDFVEKKLYEMPTPQLVKIVQAALAIMSETEQISFIAKYN